jgi:flagellar motility protein MotE (MotC chaperone)
MTQEIFSTVENPAGTEIANHGAPADAASGSAPAAEPKEKAAENEEDYEKYNSVFHYDPLQSLAVSLQEKERQLNERERRLNLEGKRLQSLRREIEENLTQSKSTLRAMEKIAGRADQNHEDQIATWIEIYQKMKPLQAAPILSDLKKDFSLQLLSDMDPKKAAKILELMKPEMAILLGKLLNKREI